MLMPMMDTCHSVSPVPFFYIFASVLVSYWKLLFELSLAGSGPGVETSSMPQNAVFSSLLPDGEFLPLLPHIYLMAWLFSKSKIMHALSTQ